MTLLSTPEQATIEPRLLVLAATPSVIVEEAVWEKPVTYETDCVTALKLSGDLPNKSVSPTNLAKDIPVKPLELTEGGTAVISTWEGDYGHVVKVRLVQGNLVSIVEGGYPAGTGRIIDPQLVKGEVAIPPE